MYRAIIRNFSKKQDICYVKDSVYNIHVRKSLLCNKIIESKNRLCNNVKLKTSYYCHCHTLKQEKQEKQEKQVHSNMFDEYFDQKFHLLRLDAKKKRR